MIEDMTIRNLSRSTQQSYVYAVAKFSRHFNCPRDRLGMEEVRAYQLHLVGQDRGHVPGDVADEKPRFALNPQANEILRKASAYFAQAELDRRFRP